MSLEQDYLLGRLSEAERDAFQQQLLEDSGLFERIREEENDLLDDYSAGRLNPADREAVEQRLLHNSEGQAKLRFAQSLQRRKERPIPRRRLLMAAAAVALLALGVSWMIRLSHRQQPVRFVLAQATTRSDDVAELPLPDPRATVILVVPDHPLLRGAPLKLELKDSSGRSIAAADGGARREIAIPGNAFATGLYTLGAVDSRTGQALLYFSFRVVPNPH